LAPQSQSCEWRNFSVVCLDDGVFADNHAIPFDDRANWDKLHLGDKVASFLRWGV
jgi:hypothetical protein